MVKVGEKPQYMAIKNTSSIKKAKKKSEISVKKAIIQQKGQIIKRKIVLTEETRQIEYLLKNDINFNILYSLIGDITYYLDTDCYGFMVKTIINQMLSNKVGDILITRLIQLCETGILDVQSISLLSFEEIKAIGLSQKKTQSIIDFTNYYKENDYSYKYFAALTDEQIIKELTVVKGIGIWSAKMFLIFVIGRENIIPYEDMAYQNAFIWYKGLNSFPSKQEILKLSKKWSPFNSIFARYLYIALDNGFIQKPFSVYKKQFKRVL